MDAQAVALDERGLHAISGPGQWRVSGFPLDLVTEVDLVVERFTVTRPNARMVAVEEGGVEVPVPRLARLWRGVVAGDPESSVFLGDSPAGTFGWVKTAGRTFVISTGDPRGDKTLVVFDLAGAAAEQIEWLPFECGIDQIDQPLEAMPLGFEGGLAGTGCLEVELAIDTDNAFRGKFNSNAAAIGYIETLVGASSEIFLRDVGLRLVVSFSRIWNTPSPWNAPNTSQQLAQFRDYWNANEGGVPRDLAHLLSGRNLGGGIATLSSACTISNAYAVSASLNGFFPYPLQSHSQQNWDIIVFTHELGHNLGTRHTHDTVHYNPPLDDCFTANGPGACTMAFGGTIMSYCHLCSGGLSNIRLDFHPQVASRIAAFAAGRPCLTPCGECVGALTPPSRVFDPAGGTGSVSFGIDLTPCFWSASATVSWISVTSSGGMGPGVATYSVAANPGPVTRVGSIVIDGRTHTVIQNGSVCAVDAVSPASMNFTPAGGSGSFTVTLNTATCGWAAIVTQGGTWLTLEAPASGVGPGAVSYSVAPNSAAIPRVATIAVGGQIHTVVQQPAPCQVLALVPDVETLFLPGCGGEGLVQVVMNGPTCQYTTSLAPPSPWFQIVSGSSGTAGPVNFIHDANPLPQSRSVTLSAAAAGTPAQSRLIVQGAGGCEVQTLSPPQLAVSADGGPVQLQVLNSGPGCFWQVRIESILPPGDNAWLEIVSGGTGVGGQGAVVFFAESNSGGEVRMARVVVGSGCGDEIDAILTQAPCVPESLTPAQLSVPAAGVWAQEVVVGLTGNECGWWATSQNSWIQITSGVTGIGGAAGPIVLRVLPNATGTHRTGAVDVSGLTLLVNQAPCEVLTVLPQSSVLPAAGGVAVIGVTADASVCTWSAHSSVPWLSCVSGFCGGTGLVGTVVFAAESNQTGAARSGLVTIGGRQHLVEQLADGCLAASIEPPFSQFGPCGTASGTASIDVQLAEGGCAWNASTTVPWVTIVSGGSGQGADGVVTYQISPNPSADARAGFIAVNGLLHEVVQAGGGCSLTFSPSSFEVGAEGLWCVPAFGGDSCGSTTVSSAVGWTLLSSASWLEIMSGWEGQEQGQVLFRVKPNVSGQTRTAFIHQVGHPNGPRFTVTQAGGTLQEVLASVPSGVHIQLGPGVHQGPIDYAGRELFIEGVEGAEATVIEAHASAGSVVLMAFPPSSDGVRPRPMLKGVTIRAISGSGGVGAPILEGGGLRVAHADAEIEGCVFSGLTAFSGGAVSILGGAPSFIGCRFEWNASGGDGGAVRSVDASPRFIGTAFHGNTAEGAGGAIHAIGGEVRFDGGLIRDGSASQWGGAIAWSGEAGALHLESISIEGNQAPLAGAIWIQAGSSPAQIAQSRICGNGDDGIWGPWIDLGGNDFCLCPADLTGSGLVGGGDLAMLLAAWGICPPGGCPADLNGDGKIDGLDLGLMLAAWGACP